MFRLTSQKSHKILKAFRMKETIKIQWNRILNCNIACTQSEDLLRIVNDKKNFFFS